MYSSTIGTMLTAASFSTIAAAKPSWSSWAESPLFSSEPCFGDRCGIPSVKRNLAPVIFWNSRYASFPQKATNRWRRVSSATSLPACTVTSTRRCVRKWSPGRRCWLRTRCFILPIRTCASFGFAASAPSPRASRDVQKKNLLAGKLAVPGVELRPLDRWTILTALIALNDPEAQALFASEQKRDNTGDGQKYAYVAEA